MRIETIEISDFYSKCNNIINFALWLQDLALIDFIRLEKNPFIRRLLYFDGMNLQKRMA